MKQKINMRLIGIAVLAVLATLVCMTFIYYSLFQRQVRKDLRIDAQVLGETGAFEDVSSLARNFDIAKEDLRITWIDKDGTVLYESELLKPGYGLTEVPLNQTLKTGEYTAMVVYKCVTLDEEETPLNSAESEFKLIVK